MDTTEPTPQQWTAAMALELSIAIKEAGTTQKRVSTDSNITEQSVGRYIRGERELSQAHFIAICRAIRIAPATVWDRVYRRLGVPVQEADTIPPRTAQR